MSRPSAPLQVQPPQSALANAKLADDYRKAIMAYGRGAYSEARQAFQNVFDVEPTGDLADNALFWIGETYFATRDYNNAMRYYARVVAEYADQNKAPDALYKTALAQEKTGDFALARKTLAAGDRPLSVLDVRVDGEAGTAAHQVLIDGNGDLQPRRALIVEPRHQFLHEAEH